MTDQRQRRAPQGQQPFAPRFNPPRGGMPGQVPPVAQLHTDTGRNRRSAPPPPRKEDPRPGQAGRVIAAVLLGLLLLGAVLSFLQYTGAQAQLAKLRTQREEARMQHEEDVGYYVSMRRSSGYLDTIRQYAQEFQVDTSFISAIIARESHYDPNARAASTGALGLMQVMEDTGTWISERLGVRDYAYDRLREPDLNIRFGAWYLNYLSAHFNGNPVMIASAYHAGPNNVKQWALKYAADQKTLTVDQIPMEDTRDYVRKVMNAYALFYEYDSGNFKPA